MKKTNLVLGFKNYFLFLIVVQINIVLRILLDLLYLDFTLFIIFYMEIYNEYTTSLIYSNNNYRRLYMYLGFKIQ